MQRLLTSLHGILPRLGIDPTFADAPEAGTLSGRLAQSTTPDEVYAALRAIGAAAGAPEQADSLVSELEERINIILHKLKFVGEEQRPRVLLVQGYNPPKAVDDPYLSNLVRIAGGRPCTDRWEIEKEGQRQEPDVLIFLIREPVSRALGELPALLDGSAWRMTAAVDHDQVFIVHHALYLQHPGPLIADDVEILAEIIHPKYFVFGRDNDAWLRFSLR